VVQESAESFTPHERTATAGPGGRSNQPTAQSLVRTFFVVVRYVFAHELSEMSLPQRDYAVEAFLLDGTVESLTNAFN
jgi:hypothetical protein